jgi:hypothetical protein
VASRITRTALELAAAPELARAGLATDRPPGTAARWTPVVGRASGLVPKSAPSAASRATVREGACAAAGADADAGASPRAEVATFRLRPMLEGDVVACSTIASMGAR